MKRPPGLWILLSAGVLWLSLQDVYGIRATALIFGKSSTSTTTEATSSFSPETANGAEAANNTESATNHNSTSGSSNSTNPVLTGIPQIDYIYDPNLPQELNGYNLSEYPFYERVPEKIDFKCDGLHDGFYASVPHKCQVYHHCLFGTRFDFLCANYTAFDQKTFICHFVSEVDCPNSKKFWHRNDALYTAQSTTTTAPINLTAAIYTTAPPDAVNPITPLAPRRQQGARRPYRPRRRRPPVEYYDDEYYDDEEYYDDRRGLRRKRPRRPMHVYDGDYEEYEDERYESRRANRRRPYRNQRRNKGRRKPEYEDEEEADDRLEDEDLGEANKRQKVEERRKHQSHEDESAEEQSRKRPSDRKSMKKNPSNRRPSQDYEEDELPESDDSRGYEQRPRKKPKENKTKEGAVSIDGRPIIKPATGTIYDRPRVAPRINLPVPKNAADKYAYKAIGSAKPTVTTTTTTVPSLKDEVQYEDEDYEEPVPAKQRPVFRDRKPEGKRDKPKSEESRTTSSVSRPRTRTTEDGEKPEKVPVKPKYETLRSRFRPSVTKKPPIIEEYEDEEYLNPDEKVMDDEKLTSRNAKKPAASTSTTTPVAIVATTKTTTTTEVPPVRKEPVMRIIKRPFLPSRGGNPYNGRGLQPVGLKAADKAVPENDSQESRITEQEPDYEEEAQSKESEVKSIPKTEDRPKPLFKPSPTIVKVPVRPNYVGSSASDSISPEYSRQQGYKAPPSTQRPKLAEKNPLDLNEYDVTLNEALSPTLPNLPVRAFPTGFSSGGDYGYTTYSRPRYVLEPVLSPTDQNYVFSNKRSQQRYEPQVQFTEVTRGYRQQQQQPQHGQTQAILSRY